MVKTFNIRFSKVLVSCSIIISSLMPGSVQAEYFGLPSGRTANISSAVPLSVEAGYVTGELAGLDYDNLALRINHLFRDNLQLFANVAQASVGKNDSTALGFGVYYELGDLFNFSKRFALKSSFHRVELSRTVGGVVLTNCNGLTTSINPFTGELILIPEICTPGFSTSRTTKKSVTALAIELLVSGNPMTGLGFEDHPASWYANVGVHSFNNSNLDSEIGFGGGIIFPFTSGEVYAGLDIIDDELLGVGVRYYLK